MDALFGLWVLVIGMGFVSMTVAFAGRAFERPHLIRLGAAWSLVALAALMWIMAAGIVIDDTSRAAEEAEPLLLFTGLGWVSAGLSIRVARGMFFRRTKERC